MPIYGYTKNLNFLVPERIFHPIFSTPHYFGHVEHSRKQKKTVYSTDFAAQKIVKYQAIFSVKLQVILKMAWGEAKI
ncbi:MAG: hypothetical protein GY820_40210 [Gammaproteobacteria bacterium]|nr:hypothetical protein [Gammaproteobacteria bacterium]